MTVRSISASQSRGLRHAVLRAAQPREAAEYPGDTDASTLHVGAFADGALVGVASVYRQAPPDRDGDEHAWRLRGMATHPSARGRGHGAALLGACLGHVARQGGRRLWCNARTPAAGFYTRHGFARLGEVFDIPPIGPHVVMEREVIASDSALGLVADRETERITTLRLVLRRWRADDLDALAAINADAETMGKIGLSRPLSRAESARSLATLDEHWQVHGFGLWAVEERATGRLIGRAGLWHPPDWPDTEIGWLLARDRWGQGLATEAARAGLAYGFGHRRIDRLGSIMRPDNTASERVAVRIGMRFAGDTTWRGNPVRTYAITREEWREVARNPAGAHGV